MKQAPEIPPKCGYNESTAGGCYYHWKLVSSAELLLVVGTVGMLTGLGTGRRIWPGEAGLEEAESEAGPGGGDVMATERRLNAFGERLPWPRESREWWRCTRMLWGVLLRGARCVGGVVWDVVEPPEKNTFPLPFPLLLKMPLEVR
jgi:hypothetical protein